jgi:hypothetical protein
MVARKPHPAAENNPLYELMISNNTIVIYFKGTLKHYLINNPIHHRK